VVRKTHLYPINEHRKAELKGKRKEKHQFSKKPNRKMPVMIL
jgi:hypothetical protein